MTTTPTPEDATYEGIGSIADFEANPPQWVADADEAAASTVNNRLHSSADALLLAEAWLKLRGRTGEEWIR